MAENDTDLEVEVEEIAEAPEVLEGEEDTTDYKALALKNAGIAKRYKTKFEKAKLAQKVDKGVEKALEIEKKEKKEFDYGELAFLEAKGVSEEDQDFILKEVQQTGKGLKDVLNFKYVQEELKSRKDERIVKNALPTSKRSSGAAKDDVDYWIQKGEMPSRAENPELYRKIRKEKERRELEHQSTPPR